MEVKFSRLALADLTHIRSYIAQFNPSAAERMAKRLLAAAYRLAEHPMIGKETLDASRELSVVPPYIIAYDVFETKIVIMRIWHGAQDRKMDGAPI